MRLKNTPLTQNDDKPLCEMIFNILCIGHIFKVCQDFLRLEYKSKMFFYA